MANYSTFVPIALLVALSLSFLKIRSLKEELQTQENNNGLFARDLDKIRDKNFVLEQRLKREAEERGGVELKWRDCLGQYGKQQRLAKEATDALQSKDKAYDVLNKELTDAKEALEVKKREMTKAAEESKRYHDLYEAGNAQLNDVRHAYENLRKLVQMEAKKEAELRAGGLKGNVAEFVVRREAAGGAGPTVESQNNAVPTQNEAGKAREEVKQEGIPTDKTKPSGQEQNVTKSIEEEKQQQQQQQKEEGKEEERAAREAEEIEGDEEEGEVKAEEEGNNGEREKEDDTDMEMQGAGGRDEDGVDVDGEEEENVRENAREERNRRSVSEKRMNKMRKSMKESVKRRGA